MANGYGISDPAALVNLGQEGTGAAQKFNYDAITEDQLSRFRRDEARRLKKQEEAAKEQQKRADEINKITPDFGIIQYDVPHFKKQFTDWQVAVKAAGNITPELRQQLYDIDAELAMQKQQYELAKEYSSQLTKVADKLSPQDYKMYKDALQSYWTAGSESGDPSPIARYGKQLPEILVKEEVQPYSQLELIDLAREMVKEPDFKTTTIKDGVETQVKGLTKKSIDDRVNAITASNRWEMYLQETGIDKKEAEDWLRGQFRAVVESQPTKEGGGGFVLNFGGRSGVEGKYSMELITEPSTPDAFGIGKGDRKTLVFNDDTPEKSGGIPVKQIEVQGRTINFSPSSIEKLPDGKFIVRGFSQFQTQDESYQRLQESFVIDPEKSKPTKRLVENAWFGGNKIENWFETETTTEGKKKIQGW